MRFVLIACIGLLLGFCSQPSEESVDQAENIFVEEGAYDSLLAKDWGADDYGMRKFVIAFLKKGPNRDQDSIKAAALQRAHMDNITKMAEEGKLVLAGPFFANEDYQGIYVFAVNSIEEAEELTKTDPAIEAGRLVMDLKEWYGSAALMGINEAHKKISKEDI